MHNDRVGAVANVLALLQWSYSHCKYLLLCVAKARCITTNRSFLKFNFFKQFPCSFMKTKLQLQHKQLKF